MLLIEPISAITSWEDYEYQGHVALYVALKSILDLLQNGKSISGYDLQLRVKKNFVNQLNNLDKMSQTLYLSIEDIVYEGMTLLWVYVPPTSTVEKCANRIYDRNEDGDMDITDSPIQLQNMYNRKSNTYAEHKIFPYVTTEDLRRDLMDKVRNLAKSKIRIILG